MIKDIIDLESVLRIVGQISQEQAWAICYNLIKPHKLDFRSSARKIQGLKDILIHKDGFVQLKTDPEADDEGEEEEEEADERERELVASLGIALFRALDYGIADDEERKLSIGMEYLIYQSQNKLSLCEILDLCTKRLSNSNSNNNNNNSNQHETTSKLQLQQPPTILQPPTNPDQHYREVCRSLVKDTIELSIFLDKIYTASMVLRDTISLDDCSGHHLNHLHHLNHHLSQQHHHLDSLDPFGGPSLASFRINDWARLWMQVMKELRQIQLSQ